MLGVLTQEPAPKLDHIRHALVGKPVVDRPMLTLRDPDRYCLLVAEIEVR